MTSPVLQRVVRRETHSPRTVATVIVLILLAAGAVVLAFEIVRHLSGLSPWLFNPGAAATWLADLPDAPQAAVVAGGLAVAAAGLLILWFAVAPGRRPKHQLGAFTHPVLTDNGVIASALAEDLRRELDLARDGVVVGISHRTADVTVRPEPGQLLEAARVRALAEQSLSGYSLLPAVTVRVRVHRRAETGGAS